MVFIFLICIYLLKLCQDLVVTHRIFSCGVWSLSCSMWDLLPWLGIESRSPAFGAQSLSHCSNREGPWGKHLTCIISFNSPSGRGYYYYSFCWKKKNEAPRGSIICLNSHPTKCEFKFKLVWHFSPYYWPQYGTAFLLLVYFWRSSAFREEKWEVVSLLLSIR